VFACCCYGDVYSLDVLVADVLVVSDALILQGSHASCKVLKSTRFLKIKFPGPEKSLKMTLVLESPGNYIRRSCYYENVLEKIGCGS